MKKWAHYILDRAKLGHHIPVEMINTALYETGDLGHLWPSEHANQISSDNDKVVLALQKQDMSIPALAKVTDCDKQVVRLTVDRLTEAGYVEFARLDDREGSGNKAAIYHWRTP